MADEPMGVTRTVSPNQSIGDTIVQLFDYEASVLMARVDRFNRDADGREHNEHETSNY